MGKRKHQDSDSDQEEDTPQEAKKPKSKSKHGEEETSQRSPHKKRKHVEADESEEPSLKKIKKENEGEVGEEVVVVAGAVEQEALSYEELAARVIAIAKPLACQKLAGRLYKAIRKAAKHKTLRRGVKEVTKSLRKGEKGIAVLAGDISPLDVISHVPVYCEEQSVPYVFVPSRFDLGSAALTKRPTSVVLIKQNKEYEKHYTRCMEGVTSLPHPLL